MRRLFTAVTSEASVGVFQPGCTGVARMSQECNAKISRTLLQRESGFECATELAEFDVVYQACLPNSYSKREKRGVVDWLSEFFKCFRVGNTHIVNV